MKPCLSPSGTTYFTISVLSWWNSIFEALHWQRLSVGYERNDNRHRIGERVGRVMVFQSDHKYLYRGYYLQSSISEYHFCVRRQYCTVPPVCCDKLSCITTPMLYYNFKLCRQNFVFSLCVGKIEKQYGFWVTF